MAAPGRPLEDNEDPVQAVLREILEETAEVAPTGVLASGTGPSSVHLHDPVDGYHQHIDRSTSAGRRARPFERRLAVGEQVGYLTADGAPAKPPPEDVRLLALKA